MDSSHKIMAANIKRRWLQFSLRTFLLAVAVAAVGMAVLYRRSPIDASNAAKLQQVGNLDKDVRRIEWSPDRRRAALVSWEQPVEIRDLTTLKLLDTYGQGQKIIHFAFSSQEGLVAYCQNDNIAVIADLKRDRQFELDTGNPQPTPVFSPDGELLATGGYGNEAKLWRTSDGQPVAGLDVGRTIGGLTPAFSPDGRLLAVGNRNSVTTVFDVATGKLLYALPKASSQGLQFNPKGDLLAVTYVDATLAIWQASDGGFVHERRTNAEELYQVEWSPDGNLLATCGLNAPITIWDASNLTVLRELPAPEMVIGVSFSPDGMGLYCAGGSRMPGGKRSLQVWGVEGPLFSLLNRPRE